MVRDAAAAPAVSELVGEGLTVTESRPLGTVHLFDGLCCLPRSVRRNRRTATIAMIDLLAREAEPPDVHP